MDVPRFLAALGKRLVLAGYGRVEISRAGSLLERTLADLLVGSPERLDFVAGAVCDKGLEQRRPEPEQHPGGLLDTAKLPDLTAEEEAAYQEIIRQLKEQAQPTQETVKAEYLEQEAEKLASSSGGEISLEQARETVRTRQGHVLADADLLQFAHQNKPVSVAYALDSGPEFDGKACADPLEPEYNGGSRSTAKFYWNEGRKPLVRSYAHGGIQYTFSRFQALGGIAGHAQDADNKEQPGSPLPLIKKDELSEPFPFHVLRPLIEEACRDIQQAVQTPDALIAQCVLASANLAVQPLRDMDIDGRGFPLSLYLLTIAATGERKSSIDQPGRFTTGTDSGLSACGQTGAA